MPQEDVMSSATHQLIGQFFLEHLFVVDVNGGIHEVACGLREEENDCLLQEAQVLRPL